MYMLIHMYVYIYVLMCVCLPVCICIVTGCYGCGEQVWERAHVKRDNRRRELRAPRVVSKGTTVLCWHAVLTADMTLLKVLMPKELLEGENFTYLVSSEKVLQYDYVSSYYYIILLPMCPHTNHLSPCRLKRTEEDLCPCIDSRRIDALEEEHFTRMLHMFY